VNLDIFFSLSNAIMEMSNIEHANISVKIKRGIPYFRHKLASMSNNDILRKIRKIFELNDTMYMKLIGTQDYELDINELRAWMLNEDDPAHEKMDDYDLAVLLNAIIEWKRGKREGEKAVHENYLNNNQILRKLKIALSLKDEDMLYYLEAAGRIISKHELSAFFRHPEQAQYRECQDQILRNFLQGLELSK